MINDQEDLFPDLGDKQQGLDFAVEKSDKPAKKEQAPLGLDIPQVFEQGTSFQVRDAFEKLVQLEPARFLGRRHRGTAARDVGAAGELPEVLTPQNLGRIWASSMGLSFAVPDDVDALAVTASWGRYSKTEVVVEDAKGRERTASTWTRKQVDHARTVRLDGKPSQRITLTMERAEDPGVLLAVAVRPQGDGRRVVSTAAGAGRGGEADPEGGRGRRSR